MWATKRASRCLLGGSQCVRRAERLVTPVGVLGRSWECKQLDELVDAVRGGESRALVLRGEPGVGKTTLLEYLVERARGFRIVRITGIQSELELAFAGLHQLCRPMMNRLPDLPAVQRDAVNGAFGLGSERAPDGHLVALGVLSLLSAVARDQPLLCIVDDAQWLDRASMQALAFAGRRLLAESVAIVFATRALDDALPGTADTAGLPDVLIEGLPDHDARALLCSVLPGPWDERVLGRIVAETRGIPLALLELPKTSTLVDLAGGYGLPSARPVADRIQAAFLERIAGLPPEARRFLLAAAADPTGEPALLWLVAEQLGIGIDASAPAAAAGLLTIDDRVRFAHPMVRSAVYWAASAEERRSTHRALARVMDPAADPDRRAWHAAHGASGPDEVVAAELERSAERARTRGGGAAEAAFMARAVELTLEPGRRQMRALAAARAAYEAGSLDIALKLLSIVEAGPLDERRRGAVDLMRARIAFTTNRGSDAPDLLLKAASQLASHDMALARETYLEVIGAAFFAGPRAYSTGQYEAARAARCTPTPPAPRPTDLLLDGMAVRITEGHPAAVPSLRAALRAFRDPSLSPEDGLRWLWLICVTAVGLWEKETLSHLAARYLRLAREAGQVAALPLALTMRCVVHVLDGELPEAASLAAEVQTISDAVGTATPLYAALFVAAWRGREAECVDLSRRANEGAARRGEGVGPVVSGWANAVLYNSLGRYEEAAEAANTASGEYLQLEMGIPIWSLVEYIEASARGGAPGRALVALHRLIEVTQPSGTDWALGIEARSRALLSEETEAESHYLKAIDRLGRTSIRGELARAHLLYGEWLRRKRRRQAAREQLRIAHELFVGMGMEGFAQRAARELAATGENIRKHTDNNRNELTAQEAQIARLVREGLTNPEIGTQLFISPRTVEWHVRNIFVKLGVTSRRELRVQAATRS
ncbi:putative HTH-type transcriptional regulatorc [Streptomyces jeddahensis]|uniref:Putative HTH-type transcriptional regulatorc n=1 Tax=Streptomyces jeddahensis TaxID=1716141 RepID=A0A177HVY8_9ACTN|nr:putative HTH-type transcriptional regulatorc [Streptomyces jeddahensis]